MATKRIKSKITSLDELPAELRDYFEEGSGDHEGSYVLAVDEVDGLGLAHIPSITGARDQEKSAAAEAKAARKAAEGELAKLRKEYEAAKQQLESRGGSKADEERLRKEFEKQVADARQELQAQLEEIQKDRDSLLRVAEEQAIDQFIHDGLTSGDLTASPKVFAANLRKHVRAQRLEDGRFEAFIADDKGNPRTRFQGGVNRKLGVQDLLGEWSKDPEMREYIKQRVAGGPGAGDASAPSGGSPGGGAGGKGVLRISRADMRNVDFFEKTVRPHKLAGGQVIVVDGESGA